MRSGGVMVSPPQASSITISRYHGFTITGPTGLFVGVCHTWNGPRWPALISLAELLLGGSSEFFFFFFFSLGLSLATGLARLDRFHPALSLINSVSLLEIHRHTTTTIATLYSSFLRGSLRQKRTYGRDSMWDSTWWQLHEILCHCSSSYCVSSNG